MNPSTVPSITMTERPAPGGVSGGRWPDAVGFVLSVALHLLIVIALLHVTLDNSSRARPSSALQVKLIGEGRVTAAAAPSEPVIPKPITNTPKPQAVVKAQAQAKPPESQARTASAASSAATAAHASSSDGEELEDIIGRFHDNWLEPPGNRDFRCRLRIDYEAGGKIVALHFLRSCGTPELDDSVKRAIWKTQMLPLTSAMREAGSLEFDFTP